MTIRRRIALVSAAAAAVTVLLISIVAFVAAQRQIMRPIDDSLLSRASIFETSRPGVVPPGFGDLIFSRDGLFGQRRGDFDATYYQLILPDGATLNAGQDDVIIPPPDEDEMSKAQPMLRSVSVDGLHLRVVTVYQPITDVFVQIARPLTEADASLQGFAVVLVFGGFLGVAVAAVLGLLVARSALKPVDELRNSISDIAASHAFDERLDASTNDEIAELADAFNGLLAELESARAEQVRLVRDAGHELRTPLTALRTNIEILQRHEVTPDERAEMIDAAHAEVKELTALVAEVVDLATDRYEEEPLSEFALGHVVADVAERALRRNGRTTVVADDGSIVVAKRAAIDRVITNITANADKWSPVGEPISVDIADRRVTVTDHGPGISEDDLDHVFERFYRSPEARSTPGSGLGLSIVLQIVDDHKGIVFARNRDDGSGAIVGFELPLST
ncbi:MAG: HAMP domain-containing histidine kinase [Actinomycetia bacterium]|nr:HAMP domain-containing histidine kinase [Actinomycetes bacterium]